MNDLAKPVGYAGSNNPRLSALRIADEPRFLVIVGEAIRLNHGIVVNAAEALKVHRNTLMRWLDNYSVLKEIRLKASEQFNKERVK
jgi:hypothetical protein